MPRAVDAQLVLGRGPRPCAVAIYGEAPGRQEQNFGQPFVGDAGAVLTTFLNWFGVSRRQVFVSNIVKFWPGEGNPDPSPEDIERDAALLDAELEEVQPRIIIALGRFASTRFLGYPVDMDLMHGIPHRGLDKRIVIPVFHPAAGLHELNMAQKTFLGLKAACEFIQNPAIENVWSENPKKVKVTRIRLKGPEVIKAPAAVDTEGTPKHPHSIQYSRWHDEAIVVSADDAKHLRFEGPVIFHNALYDVKMCRAMGVELPPASMWEDTMVKAYCRQDVPQGLKALSYRLLHRRRDSYEDLVHRYFDPLALEYLETVALCKSWRKPVEILCKDPKTGKLVVYKPQPVHQRASNIVRAFKKAPETDMAALWENILPEYRAEVEEVMGPFPRLGLGLVPVQEADQYGGDDSADTWAIHKALDLPPDLERVYKADMEVLPALLEIEENGIPFSPERSRDLSSRLQDEAGEVRETMRGIAGRPSLNPGSVKQVSEVLFRDWRIRSPRKTKLTGNDSSDDRALATLALQYELHNRPTDKDKHRFIRLLQEYRELVKLDGTYARSLPGYCHDGRVRPRIRNTQVVSGRLSSADPNLQNIPSRTERGKLIRSCFVAPEGRVLLSVDYSQIELRILAHESRDKALIEAFTGKEDLHRKTEKYIFGVPDSEAGKKRVAAKTFNFRIAYAGPNGSPRGLQEQLFLDGITLTVNECAAYRDQWFAMYPKVAKFLREAGDEARLKGYAQTTGGRIRYLPFARLAEVPRARAEAERQAGNLKIQGAAQEVIKHAMILWDREYRDRVNKIAPTRLCMQIHDELMFETVEEPKKLKRVARLLVEMMLSDTEHYRVPILAEAKAGRDWGAQEKLAL